MHAPPAFMTWYVGSGSVCVNLCSACVLTKLGEGENQCECGMLYVLRIAACVRTEKLLLLRAADLKEREGGESLFYFSSIATVCGVKRCDQVRATSFT